MTNEIIVSEEAINAKIYVIIGQKVMLDRDLAELYEVETKYLKRQVKRNIERFPGDFMFILSEKEFKNWRSQIVTSNSGDKMGLRYSPMAFTEQGILWNLPLVSGLWDGMEGEEKALLSKGEDHHE